MTTSGKLGASNYTITIEANGTTMVRVWRDYPSGVPATVQRVWQIVADFGGFKRIAPSVLSVYLTYPDATDAVIHTVRSMTFAPSDPGSPLSSKNPLPIGVEQLIELDDQRRRLTYISVLGLPVQNYRSVMEVTGDDACRLTWTSSFTTEPNQAGFADTLAAILAGGANQIAITLGLE